MAGRRLSQVQVKQLVVTMEALRAQIASGDLTASTALIHRLEGAILALKVVQGDLADPGDGWLSQESI